MKKLLALLLAAMIIITVFTGCGEADAKTKDPDAEISGDATEGDTKDPETSASVLTFNIGMEPSTLDPGLNSGVDGTQVLNHMYEGLMKEENGEFICAAAESYDVSADGLVYTFNLRDSNWSDGEPVRAQDFEFAWSRVLDEAVASQYAWIFSSGGIDSFQAIDEKTFEVTLIASNPVFLSLLGNTTFMPLREDVINYLDGAWAVKPATVITNGAYVMSEYTAGDRLILDKSETYHDAANIKIDQLIGLMIADETTALTGYESGDIDVITAIPPAEIPRLLNEEPDFIVVSGNSTNFYAFNTTTAPFDDVRVRQALSYSIDRTAIVKDVLKGGQLPAHSLVPTVVLDHDGLVFNEVSGNYGIAYDTSNVSQAQELLADAGYPNGEGFPEVELLYNTSETVKAVAFL